MIPGEEQRRSATRIRVLVWIQAVFLLFSEFAHSFPGGAILNHRSASYFISSRLFSSPPYGGKRRRKRDILKSWTLDRFQSRKDPLIAVSSQNHATPNQPQAKNNVQERHGDLVAPAIDETNTTKNAEVWAAGKASATSVLLAQIHSAVASNNRTIVSLPTLHDEAGQFSHSLTPLEKEFRDMVLLFANYTHRDMLAIPNPRYRALLQGVAASAETPAVYRAFEVLFEDLLPLRVAGRVVFQVLRRYMVKSVAQQDEDIAHVMQVMGYTSREQLEELRLLFIMIASQLNDEKGSLTPAQLLGTGVFNDTAEESLGFASPWELVDRVADEGKVTFVSLLTGLWRCAEDVCALEPCDPQSTMHDLLLELNDSLAGTIVTNMAHDTKEEKSLKTKARYDGMVASFVNWKDRLPPQAPDESRRMQVVRGCFVGAEIPQVVDALRIVYMEYRGLRLAGDIIFALVSKRIKRRG